MAEKISIDLKDRKILYELDRNSRQSFNELGKKVGLSKDAVAYRIDNLLKNGIIKSFNAVIDTGKLGFKSFRLFVKFYNLSPEKEQEIINFFLKNKNLLWLVQVEGNWDINTWFLYKSIEEMDEFWKKFLEKYNNYIEKREFAIYSNVYYFNRVYLLEKKQQNPPVSFISQSKEENLDEKDLEIINLLAENARVSIIEISSKTKLTPKTIISRIKKLEERKVMIGYRTEFDLEKLGYKYYKIHISTFNSTKEKLEKLKNYLYAHQNILYDNEVLGGYDVEIEIQVENENKLREFIEELRKSFSGIIRDYEILHYYKEYRLRFFPLE